MVALRNYNPIINPLTISRASKKISVCKHGVAVAELTPASKLKANKNPQGQLLNRGNGGSLFLQQLQ